MWLLVILFYCHLVVGGELRTSGATGWLALTSLCASIPAILLFVVEVGHQFGILDAKSGRSQFYSILVPAQYLLTAFYCALSLIFTFL